MAAVWCSPRGFLPAAAAHSGSVLDMTQTPPDPGAEALGQARWICRPSSRPGRADTGDDGAAPIFRRAFSLESVPRRAVLRIAGLGIHAIRVNGVPVGVGALEPAQSDPREVVYYATHDVTDLLEPGENTLEVTLGRGFFDMSIPRCVALGQGALAGVPAADLRADGRRWS
ncbi:hypothetical protein FEZ32_03105 [Acidipropionibacterium jensenii]|nr:hypothetical protein FEZ32_03105 [Acidipropionibacterium jensenii]